MTWQEARGVILRDAQESGLVYAGTDSLGYLESYVNEALSKPGITKTDQELERDIIWMVATMAAFVLTEDGDRFTGKSFFWMRERKKCPDFPWC